MVPTVIPIPAILFGFMRGGPAPAVEEAIRGEFHDMHAS